MKRYYFHNYRATRYHRRPIVLFSNDVLSFLVLVGFIAGLFGLYASLLARNPVPQEVLPLVAR